MKRFVTGLLMIVCIAAGAAHWLDLVNYTDHTTGFVTYGSYWLRYALLGTLLLLILLASFLVPRRACPAAGYAPVQGLLALALGVAMAYLSGLRLFRFQLDPMLSRVLTVLYFLGGIWFLLLGRSWISSKNETPTRSSAAAIFGTLSLALLTIERFCLAPTSIVRVAVTFSALAALAGLLYAVAQAKEAFLRRETGGSWLYFTGMTSFLLGTCLALPEAICYYLLHMIERPALVEGIVLGILGLCGLASAFAAVARPALTGQPTETAAVGPAPEPSASKES